MIDGSPVAQSNPNPAFFAPDGLPWPMTVVRALTLLPCGKHWLLAHLRAWPLYHGRPTHRFAGRSIVFTPTDFHNLLESLPCRSASDAVRVPHSSGWSEPSRGAVSGRAPEPPTPSSRKSSGRRGPRNFMKKPKEG